MMLSTHIKIDCFNEYYCQISYSFECHATFGNILRLTMS